MVAKCSVFLVSLMMGFVPSSSTGTSAAISLSANPIRRVVQMLQMMQAKIEADGDKEEQMFKKFMCWCKTGGGDLVKSIQDAETKIPQVESNIKSLSEEVAQLTMAIQFTTKARAQAKAAVTKATVIRKKALNTFTKQQADDTTNLKALKRAVKIIGKGQATGFLQTGTASVLRTLSVSDSFDLNDAERDVLSSFLSAQAGQEANYAPQNSEITGILKQMEATMAKSIADGKAAEASSKASFDGLMAAKDNEINALSKAMEAKVTRKGEAGVQLVNLKEDKQDTTKSLTEDKKFLADLKTNCKTRAKEWAQVKKTRADELLALAETIKILDDDDSLDLFKKVLPSAKPVSFLQIQATHKEVREEALAFVQLASKASSGAGDSSVSFIASALKGGKVSFVKVIKMVDDMVKILGKEQKADDTKKSYCELQLKTAQDEAKGLDKKIKDIGKAISNNQDQVSKLTDEIAALVKTIKDLDTLVATATTTRKAEHEQYVTDLASNNAAKDLIGLAKNRLLKFYNPKMYKAAPGGLARTALERFTALDQDSAAPPPPPEAVGAYKKKGEESSGVLAMMDVLVGDLDKQIVTLQTEEKDSQGNYVKLVDESQKKRRTAATSVSQKEEAKAGLDADFEKKGLDLQKTQKQAMQKADFIKDLHQECDWLLSNFKVRMAARASEVEALSKAKAVLSGADYSLLQTSSRRHLRVAHEH